jgi:hypothetical protein
VIFVGKRLGEPDDRLVRWGWLAFAAWTVIGCEQLWQSLRAGEDALVGTALVTPLWAAWVLWLLWRAAIAARRAAKRRALGRWHGRYYKFDGRQIRVVFAGEQVFVAAADVFDALDIDTPAREPRRVRLLARPQGLTRLPDEARVFFTECGLWAWMERRTDAMAVRFANWLKAEVIAPWSKGQADGPGGDDADGR